MQFNTKDKELTLKVVYYGPALSGKTTNIEALHGMLDPVARGRLMTIDTKGDRTLFFDLLPVHFHTRSGFKVKVKLFTVPGQVVHESTRRIVLSGTDAICFIADAQRGQRSNNNQAYKGMLKNLKSNGVDAQRVPIVIQFNKLDLPDTLSPQELQEYESQGKEPIVGAIAIRGKGVIETLRKCMEMLWLSLERDYSFQLKLGITREEFMNGVFQRVGASKPAGPPEVQS